MASSGTDGGGQNEPTRGRSRVMLVGLVVTLAFLIGFVVAAFNHRSVGDGILTAVVVALVGGGVVLFWRPKQR